MVERQAKLSPSGCEARRKGTPARAQSSAVAGNDDFRLDEGPGFGESQIAKSSFPRPPAGTSPAPEGGFRVSGLLDLLAESQITATPRHSAPGAGACQPAQRSGHQGRRLVWATLCPERWCYV